MQVYEFLNYFLYGLVSSYGVTSKLFSKWVLWLINTGLANIYFQDEWRNAKLFSRQVRREAFPSALPLKIQTKYPILWIEWIYCAKMPEPDWFMKYPCDCKPNKCVPWCTQTVDCWSCNVTNCDKVALTLVSAGKKLCAWEMQISRWRSNWWFWWQIVSVELPHSYSCGGCRSCDAMFIEYYAWYEQIRCFDDEINLPLPLLSALSYFVASDVLSISWTNREQQSTDFYQKALKLITAFKSNDTSVNGIQNIDMNTEQYAWKNVTFPGIDNNLIPNTRYLS